LNKSEIPAAAVGGTGTAGKFQPMVSLGVRGHETTVT
jgi:hypothetical protein